MSKNAKARSKMKRKANKMAAKAAKKALYASYAGSNNSKRNGRLSRKKTSFRYERHLMGPCGNIGCKRAGCHA